MSEKESYNKEIIKKIELKRSYGILCTCGGKKRGEDKEKQKTTNALSGTCSRREERGLVAVVLVVAEEKVMHAGVTGVSCVFVYVFSTQRLCPPCLSAIVLYVCVRPPFPTG